MRLCYSRASAPTAQVIADESDEIFTVRSSDGDINWGRAHANTRLNADTSKCTNKRVMRQLFQENNVPMPKLYSFDYVANQFGGGRYMNLIGRPDTHTRGRGFWRITNVPSFYRAVQGTRRKAAATHFMEFIDAPHEYRVHVFLDKSIRISEKLFNSTDGNHKIYTTIKPRGEVKHVREAAKAAVKAVGLDFGAVDVLATDEDCWVLEVNSAPHIGGSLPRVYAEKFLNWYKEAV